MLDIKWIRDHPEEFDRIQSLRGIEPHSSKIIELDEAKRGNITKAQNLQQQRNEINKELSRVQDKLSAEFNELRNKSESLKLELELLENEARSDTRLQEILERMPNLLSSEVPPGASEEDNIEIAKWDTSLGRIKEIKSPKEHFEIGKNLEMMDFTKAAKISGSRFVVLSNHLAKLERALANFMIDTHVKEFGFTEMSVPLLVRPEAMYAAGQLPKFEEESFVTSNNYRLIPTSEVSLVNLVQDSIIPREKLPLRYTAYTPCFRSEAGAAGRDTRGMIRLHQFNKVELVSITAEDESNDEHELITSAAENILKKLELPYRKILLCGGDTGFSAKKTYDLEVWLPGQKKYREISSCSNCGDFQARRLKARYKEFGQTNAKLVHTLNGSGLAVGRTIVAILENYHNEDGSVSIPSVLKDYMGGIDRIEMVK
ncbi:MAG: serine--tRNA ligase [Alphaproteobacteria bacterium]|nr:serine--tRNA ligase [Alphaproteobacteria bacterium]